MAKNYLALFHGQQELKKKNVFPGKLSHAEKPSEARGQDAAAGRRSDIRSTTPYSVLRSYREPSVMGKPRHILRSHVRHSVQFSSFSSRTHS